MLEEVKLLQTTAVLSIIDKLKTNNNVTFKAPTGSGKTHMMAELMNTIMQNNNNAVFIVSSLSKGDLAKQNYDKFCEYTNNEFLNINPFLISSECSKEEQLYIPTTYNVYVLPRDLYKEKSKLKDDNVLLHFLFCKSNKALGDKDIYLIKDECHIATNNLDELSEYFYKVINMSATPKFSRGQIPEVEITEEQAQNCNLIKRVRYGDDSDNVEVAFDRLLKTKKEYEDCGFNINPCLIIQISNKDKATEQINELKTIINLKYSELQWCLIVDKDKDCETNNKVLHKILPSRWKDEIKKSLSPVDIVIFKMVITEGWDIPRACILYQIRDSKSKQLDEQVIGRVRRNPILLNFEQWNQKAQQIATQAYVWGIHENSKNVYREVHLLGEEQNNSIQEELKIVTTRLKEILEIKSFDITKFIDLQNKDIATISSLTSVFDIYKKCKNLKGETRKLYDYYVQDITKWFAFAINIDAIEKEVKNIEADYSSNMEIVKDENGNPKEVTVPYKSCFIDSPTSTHRNIENWIWERTDFDDQFSFDSSAEEKWFAYLWKLKSHITSKGGKRLIKQSNNTYLFGKNYLDNSKIKFEYYLYGIHASYPDFIMKDSYDRIHLFETKSLNEGFKSNINSDEYKEKIQALKKCYEYASRLVPYYFYIPVYKNDKWEIHQYYNGNHILLDQKSFETFLLA